MTKLLGQVGAISKVRATGSYVLVEMLTAQEIMHTVFELGVNTNTQEPPQGYIIDIGPAVDTKMNGFQLGDRVLLQGRFIPAPRVNRQGRELGLVLPSDIKAVLEETE